MPNARYYKPGEKPPVKLIDNSPKVVKVYGWKPDKDGHMQPCVIGERDLDADIQAARMETLPEMMARMPGKDSLEKIQNAVSQGVLALHPEDKNVYDLRNVPTDITEAMLQAQAAADKYETLPEELKKAPGKDLSEKFENYKKAMAELLAEQQKQTEVKNDESK